MTKQTEAMKLALEALTHLQPTALASFYTIGDRDKAITALREALAEQPAQQEPVAIADGTFNHNCPVGTLLYTSPPAQRKPLTAEQIGSMYNTFLRNGGAIIKFARAIEAAHGIKGDA